MDVQLRAELTELQSEWLRHLQRWERSGVSLRTYAQRAGVDHRRLYRFKRILTDKGVYGAGKAALRFVRAELQLDREPTSTWRVQFRNGCVVEFSGALGDGRLRELLHTVSALP